MKHSVSSVKDNFVHHLMHSPQQHTPPVPSLNAATTHGARWSATRLASCPNYAPHRSASTDASSFDAPPHESRDLDQMFAEHVRALRGTSSRVAASGTRAPGDIITQGEHVEDFRRPYWGSPSPTSVSEFLLTKKISYATFSEIREHFAELVNHEVLSRLKADLRCIVVQEESMRGALVLTCRHQYEMTLLSVALLQSPSHSPRLLSSTICRYLLSNSSCPATQDAARLVSGLVVMSSPYSAPRATTNPNSSHAILEQQRRIASLELEVDDLRKVNRCLTTERNTNIAKIDSSPRGKKETPRATHVQEGGGGGWSISDEERMEWNEVYGEMKRIIATLDRENRSLKERLL